MHIVLLLLIDFYLCAEHNESDLTSKQCPLVESSGQSNTVSVCCLAVMDREGFYLQETGVENHWFSLRMRSLTQSDTVDCRQKIKGGVISPAQPSWCCLANFNLPAQRAQGLKATLSNQGEKEDVCGGSSVRPLFRWDSHPLWMCYNRLLISSYQCPTERHHKVQCWMFQLLFLLVWLTESAIGRIGMDSATMLYEYHTVYY